MRFSLLFRISNPVLPLDYRSGFVSLLKACYEKVSQETYSALYGRNTLKPFTFSPYFGNRAKIDRGRIMLNSETFILNFSTGSLELGTYFYNGLLNIKKTRTDILFSKPVLPLKT
ncbi:MAG: hypothetical protein ABSC55_22080 [Syntrophorhabdales bacterium]|jgi:CRISPR/Cas system endoribonuclease Cas6 (RAMP superfamily)